jgi:hypothetical protein
MRDHVNESSLQANERIMEKTIDMITELEEKVERQK